MAFESESKKWRGFEWLSLSVNLGAIGSAPYPEGMVDPCNYTGLVLSALAALQRYSIPRFCGKISSIYILPGTGTSTRSLESIFHTLVRISDGYLLGNFEL